MTSSLCCISAKMFIEMVTWLFYTHPSDEKLQVPMPFVSSIFFNDAPLLSLDVLDHTPKTRDDPPRLGAIGAFLWRSQTTWFPSSNILKALPSEIAWIMPPNRLTIKSCDSLILFYFFLGFSNDIDRHVCFVLALGHSSMQSLINNKGVME